MNRICGCAMPKAHGRPTRTIRKWTPGAWMSGVAHTQINISLHSLRVFFFFFFKLNLFFICVNITGCVIFMFVSLLQV